MSEHIVLVISMIVVLTVVLAMAGTIPLSPNGSFVPPLPVYQVPK